MSLKLLPLLFFLSIFTVGRTAKPCVERRITGADSVCVCNQTYCDEIPPLTRPAPGYALVFESGKSGNRFKETALKLETKPQTLNSTLTQTITLNNIQTYQKIIGFGGSFTDVTGFVLNSVPKGLSDNILKTYFSKNGIEYNMGRVPIAATDYSFHYYTYDDQVNDKNLSHFSLAKEDLDWKIPYIKYAQSLSTSPIKLFGSPWIAPNWVRTEITTNQLKGEVGGEYYQIWANYLVKFLDAYKAKNISLWGLTVQNEPTLGRKFPYNGLYYNSSMMKAMVGRNLGPLLHKSGYTSDKLKLMLLDDNVNDLQNWSDTILGDKDTEQYVQGIAYHWYGNSRTDEYPADILDKVHSKYTKQFMLMTEACHLEGIGNGRWDFGEHYAHDIIRDINHWANGWIEWNMALALTGCPKCTMGQFGSAVLVDILKGEAYKQPTFYTIGHFSKFLSRDSVRIGHKLGKDIKNLFVLTMKRPDNATVVVVLNQNNSSISLQINDSNIYLSHTIPARSIQTYIWW